MLYCFVCVHNISLKETSKKFVFVSTLCYLLTLSFLSCHSYMLVFFSQAYLEFFTSKRNIQALKKILPEYPLVNYHIINNTVSISVLIMSNG